MSDIKQMLTERHEVVEVLKKLKAEKGEIEAAVEEKLDSAYTHFKMRGKHNGIVANLKSRRNKNLNKGGKRRRMLEKQFKDLEHRFESGKIPYNKENQTMKRLGELKKEIDSLPNVPDVASEVHEELKKNADIASEHNTGLQEELDAIAELSVTYEALTRKRAKLHMKFENLNLEIKGAFDAKSDGKKVNEEEKFDDLMSRLQAGETVSINDLMWGGN